MGSSKVIRVCFAHFRMKTAIILLAVFSVATAMPGPFGQMAGGVTNLNAKDGYGDAFIAHTHAVKSKMFVTTHYCNYHIDTILSYSSQIVAGILYRVSYRIESPTSDCLPKTCVASFLKQPWVSQDRQFQSVNCN